MPSPAAYLLLNPSKPFHRLAPPRRRLHVVTCAAPRGSSGGGVGRRDAIPAGANKAKKQIVFFDAAPPVSQSQEAGASGEEGKRETAGKPLAAGGGNPALALVRRATKRTLSVLSNLPLAICEMFAIAGLMALGTTPH